MTEIWKKTKEVKEVTVTEFVGFLCHKCKKTFSADNTIEMQESFRQTFLAGYGSKFGDSNTFEITLCHSCFHEVLSPYVKYIQNYNMDKYGEEDFTCEDFENCPAKWCLNENAGCSDLDRKNYEGWRNHVEPEVERFGFDEGWEYAYKLKAAKEKFKKLIGKKKGK